MLYSYMRKFDFKKIENSDEIKKNRIKNFLDIQIQPTIEKLSNDLKALNIHNDIKPYISTEIWIVFNAYMMILTDAVLFLLNTPYSLNFIKEDKMKEDIIKTAIPVIPEMEKFITEDPIKNIFYVEDLIRKKLLTAIENQTKKNQRKNRFF